MKKKKLSGKRLTNALDQAIRDIFKKKFGTNPTCFVCGRKDFWFSSKHHPYGIQVGHYVSRKRTILRWDLLNVFPQCSSCNKTHNQSPAAFSVAIIHKIGKERLEYFDKTLRDFKDKVLTLTQRRDMLEELTNWSLDVKLSNDNKDS